MVCCSDAHKALHATWQTWTMVEPQGLGTQKRKQETQRGHHHHMRNKALHQAAWVSAPPEDTIGSCHSGSHRPLFHEGWAWGRAPVLWKPQNWGGGESWEGSLLHLDLPGLVSQGADFTRSSQ